MALLTDKVRDVPVRWEEQGGGHCLCLLLGCLRSVDDIEYKRVPVWEILFDHSYCNPIEECIFHNPL